jgi:peroxiredoxin
MTLALGAQAPDFSLPAVDGGTRTLHDYADRKVLAIVQSCNHCPYVQAWEGRMSELQTAYRDRGFALVAVSSNDAEKYPEDSFEAMVGRAREQGFTFDYLYDESQELARALGAERTPEVFLFDADRRLVYHGAIDDDRDGTAVTQHYLRDAIEAVMAGGTPSVQETPAVGCTVKWRNA